MGTGKKRKAEVDIDAERNLYTSFVSAANNVSQLYTQAVQQQRKIGGAAARQSLERIICLILKEYQHVDMVPKSALLQHLQQEYEHTEGHEHSPQQYPAQFLPPVSQGLAPHHSDACIDSTNKSARAHGLATMLTSSPARTLRVHHHATTHHAPAPAACVQSVSCAMETGDLNTTMDASSHG